MFADGILGASLVLRFSICLDRIGYCVGKLREGRFSTVWLFFFYSIPGSREFD